MDPHEKLPYYKIIVRSFAQPWTSGPQGEHEWYLWRPRGVQSRNSGGQPHTGTGGMSWWWSFQTVDDEGGLGFGGQQSPHRSEVFWEGLFLVLNARPPMGADGHRFSPNSPNLLLPCCYLSFLHGFLLHPRGPAPFSAVLSPLKDKSFLNRVWKMDFGKKDYAQGLNLSWVDLFKRGTWDFCAVGRLVIGLLTMKR